MSQSSPDPPPRSPSRAAAQLPPELAGLLVPSLQVGAGAGAVGLFVGAAAGIMQSAPPVLFALFTGAQWFALGSSYYASRRVVISAWGGDDRLSHSDKVKASTVAGAFAGLTGGLIRGRKNILPGVIMFSVFGAGGQAIANAFGAPRDPSKPRASWLDSKWSPLTPLSDQQYEKFLEEKILKAQAEIAIIDESIASLRASEEQQQEQQQEQEKQAAAGGQATGKGV